MTPSPEVGMRKFIVPVLAFLLGVTVALAMYRSVLTGRPNSPRGTGAPGTLSASPPARPPDALQEPRTRAWKLLQGGHLREAQDAFLEALALNANDEDALHGLVVVRRYMTGDNPGLLRQQAVGYWNAIKQGVETEEHYPRRSLEALIVANVQAIQEIEAHRTPAPHSSENLTEPDASTAATLSEDKIAPGATLPSPETPAAKTTATQTPPPAVNAAKPAATQTPLPAGVKLPTPAAKAVKPAATQTPPPAASKLPTPAANAVKPTKPQAPPQRAPKLPPPAPAAEPAGPQTPPPGWKVPSSAAPAAKPAATQTPPPAASKLPPAPAPAPKPAGPETRLPSTGPTPKGAEMPPTSPALRLLPPPTTSTPQAAPPVRDNRLYTVRVGPLSDRGRAAALARQLSAGGFPQARVTTQTGFRVVSEPLPRPVAENLSATLAGRGFPSQIEPLTRDAVQLVFGAFTAQKDADTLSHRITAAGYNAWVREGPVYTLQLGPYPQSSVTTITGIIKSGAPDAAVAAVPAP